MATLKSAQGGEAALLYKSWETQMPSRVMSSVLDLLHVQHLPRGDAAAADSMVRLGVAKVDTLCQA